MRQHTQYCDSCRLVARLPRGTAVCASHALTRLMQQQSGMTASQKAFLKILESKKVRIRDRC